RVEELERLVRTLVVRDVGERLLVAVELLRTGLRAVPDLRVVRLEPGCDRSASGRAARRVGDEHRDLLDLAVGQPLAERRHPDAAVSDLERDPVLGRLEVVEVRADCAGRPRLLERVAAAAPGAREDLGPRQLRARGGSGASRLLVGAAATDGGQDEAGRDYGR